MTCGSFLDHGAGQKWVWNPSYSSCFLSFLLLSWPSCVRAFVQKPRFGLINVCGIYIEMPQKLGWTSASQAFWEFHHCIPYLQRPIRLTVTGGRVGARLAAAHELALLGLTAKNTRGITGGIEEFAMENSRILDDLHLVGGLEHFLFSHILGIIIPTDEYISEGLKPPTRHWLTY